MYFKRLEMHGFKSFAEPSVIEFHEGVTCIVGPNGSGKSNISDAIRWVLGEQSPKMLRGGKMEEVIFAGTANRKSRGMAEVTLVIDNKTGILPIDYNEVAITRRMYRSGESEYLINNNQCRLRDIRELIMDTGIGVDGYSLIGQGKIADLVSNKPESRREIFEEAAGVVMYKTKKADTEKKLAAATGNLERVNDIIGEIESRIDGLREDSIKAAEYLELKKRFEELEINITLKSIDKLEEGNSAIRGDIADYTKKIEELVSEKKVIDQQLSESRQKHENLEELMEEARAKHLAHVEEINRLTNKSEIDKERLGTIERDFKRVEDEIDVLAEKKDREVKNALGIEEQKAEVCASLSKAEDNLQEKIIAHSQAALKLADLEEQIDDNKSKMFTLRNESSSKKSEAGSMESYKASLTQRKEEILSDGKAFAERMASSQNDLDEALKEKDSLSKTLSDMGSAIKADKLQLAKLQEEQKTLSREASHLAIQLSQQSARKKTIEEMESNYEGYNNAVRFIMKSNLKGIEGVAADLMKVPAGFEVAVETALGAALQNVVCKTDNDAKAAVRALKDNRAGRLTFLPVESVKGGKANLPQSVEGAKGCKGIASDIVEYDPKYEGIFRYLLGRVAIVDTMENAIDFSKKAGQGIRFVTLEGEVVNASGAITGGKYKNATANLLERKGEIESLAQKIDSTQKLIDENKTKSEKVAHQAETISEKIQQQEAQEKSLQMTALGLDSKITSAKSLCDELSNNGERQKQQLENIEKDFENVEKQTAILLKEAEECKLKSEEAEAKVKELVKDQDALKEAVDKASDEITSARIAKTNWEGQKDHLSQMLSRINDTIDDYSSQIEAKELQLKSFEDEKNKILFGSEDVEAIVKEKSREKQDLEEYMAQVSKERAELNQSIDEMTQKQISFGDTLNSYQDKKYQEEIKLSKNETLLETHKQKLWDDFEISYLQAIEYRKSDFVMSTAQKESREIKNRLRELGDVNVGSIEEYAQVSERYEFLTSQRTDITQSMDQLQEIIADMEKTIKTKFKENFDKIVVNFEEIFKKLFGGGHAELRLDNEDNPLEAGIEIIAQPPGKKLQNINLMSGGEKTMTAIALMFAVLKTTPTPFCILDEVEAALDDSNIDRFAKYLRNFEDIQFTIVTHQKATMEHADVLYGVTMPEQGISKVLSLRLGDNFDL